MENMKEVKRHESKVESFNIISLELWMKKRTRMRGKRILEEITTESFSKLMNEMDFQSQEAP